MLEGQKDSVYVTKVRHLFDFISENLSNTLTMLVYGVRVMFRG